MAGNNEVCVIERASDNGLQATKVLDLQLMPNGVPLRVYFGGTERCLYLVRTEITWTAQGKRQGTMVRMLVGDGPRHGDRQWRTLGDMHWSFISRYLVIGTPLMIFEQGRDGGLKLVRTTPNVESIEYDW